VVADKRDTPDLTTEIIKDIIDDIEPANTVIFTGGEPTIRPDFLELVKYARDIKRHPIALQTNGTMFADKSFAKEAVKHLDFILIAIHSSDPEIHDKIVGTQGMFDKTIKGFQNLLEYRQDCESQAEITTQTVISGWNAATLPDTYAFIQNIAPETRMRMTYPHPMGNAYRYADVVVPRYSQIKEYLQQCLKQYAPYLSTEAIPFCYLYPYHKQCKNSDVESLIKNKNTRPGLDPASKRTGLLGNNGRITDYTVLDLLEKQKTPECVKCEFNDQCVGVWKEYISLHRNNLDLLPIVKNQD
jgi:MoaA/NifB/PqqE/SkfB family radical SAM enzyme